MNITEALNSRFTCRAFKPEAIDKATVMDILEAANRTPSWANTQPWELFVAGGEILEDLRQACLKNVRNGVPVAADLPRPDQWPPVIDERMQQLYASRFKALGINRDDQEARRTAAENNGRFFGASAVVYICMDRTLSPWSIHDLGMLSQSIMLAATERGVASAIAFNLVIYPDLIRQAVQIPNDLSIIIAIALGYADGDNPQNQFRSERRSLMDVVRLKGF